MISDDQAEKAADWIRDNAANIADAKSDRAYKEECLRVVRSEVFLSVSDGSVALKEAEALASPEYKKALQEYREAVRNESFLFTNLKAAEMKIEVWRSQSANLRGLK